MRPRKKKRSKIVINVTSLIDVIFLLLIFFLVTSTFSEQPGLKIQLPRAFSSEPREVEELVVSVTREGKIFLNQKPVERSRLGLELRRAAGKLEDPSVVMKADRDVSYGLVIELIDLSRRAGLEKIVALTAVGRDDDGRVDMEDLMKKTEVPADEEEGEE